MHGRPFTYRSSHSREPTMHPPAPRSFNVTCSYPPELSQTRCCCGCIYNSQNYAVQNVSGSEHTRETPQLSRDDRYVRDRGAHAPHARLGHTVGRGEGFATRRPAPWQPDRHLETRRHEMVTARPPRCLVNMHPTSPSPRILAPGLLVLPSSFAMREGCCGGLAGRESFVMLLGTMILGQVFLLWAAHPMMALHAARVSGMPSV